MNVDTNNIHGTETIGKVLFVTETIPDFFASYDRTLAFEIVASKDGLTLRPLTHEDAKALYRTVEGRKARKAFWNHLRDMSPEAVERTVEEFHAVSRAAVM